MTFVLATGNPGKLREMREILAAYEVVSLSSTSGLHPDVDETGETFRDNAFLKADAACRASGLPAIADDSGLCVDALGGAPGVRSKRYGGGGLSDGALCELIMKNLQNTEHRAAKFVSSIVCVFPNGDVVEAERERRGEILREKRGTGGFGYDPVFYLPELGRSMAELSPGEKNAVSHRGRALAAFQERLTQYLKSR